MSSSFIPSNIASCVTEDKWVTIFDHDFSKISQAPINIQSIVGYDVQDPLLEISKKSGDNYLLITKHTNDRGRVDIFGLAPQIKCRYTIDLEWSNSHLDSWAGAGVYIGVGGVRLELYASERGSRFYVRGQYGNARDEYKTAFIWDLGEDNRISVTIDTDTTLGKAYISYEKPETDSSIYDFFWGQNKNQSDKTNIVELPYYRYRWVEDQFLRTFTPDTIGISPLSAYSADPDDTIVIKLYRVTQEVYVPNNVVTIGSTKYQAFGYDGPHPYDTVAAGMNKIRDAKMNATIFADIEEVRDPSYLQYLKDLIDDGWELGIHYSLGLSSMPLVNSTKMMKDEYEAVSELYGSKPLSWCSLGNLDNSTYALLAKNNYDMIFRSLRVIPQNVPGSSDIVNSNIDYWLGAVKSSASTVPIYVHQTDIEPQPSTSSVDASKFNTWLDYVIANGIRLTGYYKWYMINSNQLDAAFQTSSNENITTITADTNGYNAIILAIIKADSVVDIQQNEQTIDYLISPEGYIVFEAIDGMDYKITTKNMPVIEKEDNNYLLYVVGSAVVMVIIIIILVVNKYMSKIYRKPKNNNTDASIDDGRKK